MMRAMLSAGPARQWAKDFRDFAVKGNAVDMAVGVVVGAAFSKIVTSLVSDVINPPLGVLIGGVDFKNLQVVLRKAVVDPATGNVTQPAVSLAYGAFVSTMFDFLIVAFCLFMVVKLIAALRRMGEHTGETPEQPRSSGA